MAAVTRSANVSVDTVSASKAATISGKIAGEAIARGDALYIKAADGKLWKSTGAAANEAARFVGLAFAPASAGEAVTAYGPYSIWEYADSGLSPGALLYVGATAGGLDTAPTTGGLTPVAHVVDAQRIRVVAAT
jgi:hypothetical protein